MAQKLQITSKRYTAQRKGRNVRLSETLIALRHNPFENMSTLRQWLDITRGKNRIVALLLGAPLIALCLAAGYFLFVPCSSGPYGSRVRLPVTLQTLGPADFPNGRNTRFPESGPGVVPQHSALFSCVDGGALVSGETVFDGPEDGHYGPADLAPPSRRRGMVNFTRGLVSIETVDGPVPLALLRHSPVPRMRTEPDIFQSDMFTPADYYEEGEILPLLYGEETDETGRPLRWDRPADAVPGLMACGLSSSYNSELRRLLRRTRFAPGADFNRGRASRYHAVAQRYAKQYDLASALVLAIIHTESNFNPYAVSRSQAVGLMQIVPETAGNEVYQYLTGLPGKPDFEALFSPEHNIKYGTIYLHLLNRRYFNKVINPYSRQMCMIAAYNGGPGAVLRLFDNSRDEAVDHINSLSPDDVYKALTVNMPNAETRRYVELVLGRMQSYSAASSH